MATRQGEDIQELKLDVGLIKGDIKTMKRDMATNQKTILERMDKFAFVTITDFEREMREIRDEMEQKIKDVRAEFKPTIEQVKEDTVLVNKGFLKTGNGVFGKIGGILALALAIGIIALIIFGIFTLYPTIKGTIK